MNVFLPIEFVVYRRQLISSLLGNGINVYLNNYATDVHQKKSICYVSQNILLPFHVVSWQCLAHLQINVMSNIIPYSI